MAAQISSSIFSADKARIFRLVHMTYFETRDVLYYIYQWGTKDKDPNIPLDQHLHDVLGYSKSKIRNTFTSQQRDQIKNDPSGKSFDITLLGAAIFMACKGLRHSCPYVKTFIENRLGELIRDIRNFRNCFIHMQPFSIEEQVFNEKTEHLRELLIEALEVGTEVYSIDKDEQDKLIALVNEQVDRSIDDCIENWDITNYENNILLIQRQSILLDKGKKQLVEIYKFFSDISPASFLTGSTIHLSVGLVFTHMEIFASGTSGNGEKINYEDILEFSQNATISNGSITDVIFIEGIAGAGKTTLTKLMMSQWQANSSPMQHLLDYDLLIYFECRNSAIQSFTQLLETLMTKVISRFREGDLLKCVLNLRLLIIADGLDELNKSSKKVMQEILDLGNLTVVTIICTSRPEYIKSFYGMVPSGQHVTHIKIKGIPEHQRTEFVVKYHEELKRIGVSLQETDGLIEYLNKSSRRLEEHWRLPLNLVLLTIMWSLTPDQMNEVTSATELYSEILRLKKKRLLKKLATNETTCSLSPQVLEQKLERFILYLSWEALITLKDESIDSLPDESVERLRDACSSLEVPHEPVMSAFLVERIIYNATQTKSIFSIAHKGEHDYLAANYLIEALNGNDLRFDITSIMKNIKIHPSFCNESLRPNFIQHIINVLVTLQEVPSMPIRPVQTDSISSPVVNKIFIPAEEQPKPTSIQSVLEGLYGIKRVPSDLSRYQNVFVYTAGLLHLLPEVIISNVADEIVQLFQQSGVLDKDQWLDFLKEMKCHDSITKSIATLVPNLVAGVTNISDGRVDVYSELIPHGKPKKVQINMANNVDEIPKMEKLIMALADKRNCIIDINLHYSYRNSKAFSRVLDVGLQRLFQCCQVRRFMGRLSDVNASSLPMTIERLRVTVDPANATAMSSLFSDLSKRATRLDVLVVHVIPCVDPAILTPLPGKGDVILLISDVNSSSITWACQVAQHLQPDKIKQHFDNIEFPRCHLTTEEFADLLQEMRSHQVKISSCFLGGIVVASSAIPPQDTQRLQRLAQEALNCTFRLSDEEAIWPKYIDSRKSHHIGSQ